jgi:16S rRNA (cytosine967-C5)-methyltransferase
MRLLKPRDLALATLNHLERSPDFPNQHLEGVFRRQPQLVDRDRAFIFNLVHGVLRWRLRLDWVIQQTARFPFKKIDPAILNILRLAVYQIAYLDRVPDSAAVNEAVRQAKAEGADYVVRTVNAILRQVCRNPEQLPFPDRKKDPIRYLSVIHSYPIWLIQMWLTELGMNFTEELLSAGNGVSPLVIRTNTLRVQRRNLIEILKKDGLEAGPTSYSPEGVCVEGVSGPIHRLGAFQDGLFQVQGEAAQICSHLLSPRPAERVLDVCAGLGGKTSHLVQLTKGEAEVIGIDRAYSRLRTLVSNGRRLGMHRLQAITADANKCFPFASGELFDRILVDAPCSGLGVLSKHPDRKWRGNARDIVRLSHLQQRILGHAASVLRVGGNLLYVNCTISKKENETVVQRFLDEDRQMTQVDLNHCAPAWAKDLISEEGFLKTFPNLHGMDGFFAALLMKT